MRVLFIECDTESTWSVAGLGPGYLAAWLRKAGHEVGFLRVPIDRTVAAPGVGHVVQVRRVRRANRHVVDVNPTTGVELTEAPAKGVAAPA